MLLAAEMMQMNRLLDEALPLDAGARERWLASLPAEDAALAPVLRRALFPDDKAGASPDPLLTLPKIDPGSVPVDAVAMASLEAGAQVGPYLLVRQLGAGGMAVVWLAQRADGAFKRTVALKLPVQARARLDLAPRFAREREILAGLEHPNIARLYDAGVTADGQPYITLEYVEGQPLTNWCDAHRLKTRERLQLFLQVLDAVGYAHTRHVVHRDLKPTNILVNGSGQVRLLDFGISKLLGEPADDTSEHEITQLYGRALTPDYASPEQLRGDEVSAGTDIYSLGVLLHELLTGNRSVAATAGTSTRAPHGDLDPIVLKAVAGSPADRYASAKAFADDVRRYLAGEAVQACGAGRVYRTTRFVLRHRVASMAVAAAVVALALLAAVALAGLTRGAAPTAIAAEKSIAVLPFVDMSEKRDQEYFSDGLSEELIDHLGRAPDLTVIARTSSFQFKGRSEDVRAIGRKLGVAHLLEGSVRKAGSTMRVTAQLIRTADGSHLWSQTYDRGVGDIFKVQDEIAGEVAQTLKAVLVNDGRARGRQPNVEAHTQLLQGKFAVRRATREDVDKAVEYFKQAIVLDPGYALAWADLAGAYLMQASFEWIPLDQGRKQAMNAIETALRLDPTLAVSHYLLGMLYQFDWNWSGARNEFDRARELDPTNLRNAFMFSQITGYQLGRWDDAIAACQKLLVVDPAAVHLHFVLASALLYSGRVEESIVAARKLLDLNPRYPGASATLGVALLLSDRYAEAVAAAEAEVNDRIKGYLLPIVYRAAGRSADADAALRRLEQQEPTTAGYNIAVAYAYRGEIDTAFRWLDRAYAQRDMGLQTVRSDPLLANLRGDPRYKVLLVKLGLNASE